MRPQGIVNVHEHFQSVACVPKYLEAMEAVGVNASVAVGSPEATIMLDRSGFERETHYNEVVLEIARRWPLRFLAFPTLDPADTDNVERLRGYLRKGASGLKLYGGHSNFHGETPLDCPSMLGVYDLCEKEGIPVLFHVNCGKYGEEFRRVLSAFPRMKVICPHFCLSTSNLVRFQEFMDNNPGLYTDVSLGQIDFLRDGLRRISKRPRAFREVLTKYADRILFGTDMVVTMAEYKTAAWLAWVSGTYRRMMEREHYRFDGLRLNGLALDTDVLMQIYATNFDRVVWTGSPRATSYIATPG